MKILILLYSYISTLFSYFRKSTFGLHSENELFCSLAVNLTVSTLGFPTGTLVVDDGYIVDATSMKSVYIYSVYIHT